MFTGNSHRLIGFQVSLRRYGGISKGPESSPIENPAEIPSYRLPRQWGTSIHNILTLDPKKFSEKKQQRLFIANFSFSPHCVLHKQSTPFRRHADILRYGHYTDHTGNTMPVPYPPGTNGFLYYATSKPRIGGELRFRVTSSNDPESFASGSDLMDTQNGRPWFRPLACLPRLYPSLYDKLKEDGLVPEDLDSVLSTLAIPSYRGDQFLYSLNDPFILDFSRLKSSFSALTERNLESLRFFYQFTDCRGLSKHMPYTGSALVQFERSTNANHKDTRTVVLRFLKILTPVQTVRPDYDGYIMRPEEGKLFRRYFHKLALVTLDPPVWTLDIDQSRKGSISRALRLLWDI